MTTYPDNDERIVMLNWILNIAYNVALYILKCNFQLYSTSPRIHRQGYFPTVEGGQFVLVNTHNYMYIITFVEGPLSEI